MRNLKKMAQKYAQRTAALARRAAKRLKRTEYVQKVKKLKTYSLFISMMLGFVLSPFLIDIRWLTGLFGYAPESPVDITSITKYLLFCMLFITYCKVSPKQMRFDKMHLWLVLTQWLGCWSVYFLLYRYSPAVASGAFICVLISTATSAPVITGMLGGSVPRLATYCIATNLLLAVVAPVYFSLMGVGAEEELNAGFWNCFSTICKKVIPLALGPFFLASLVKVVKPDIHQFFQTRQSISFWLWCVALVLLMARTMGNLLNISSSDYLNASLVAGAALTVCLLQFFVGRKIGRACGDAVVGGQCLGQKNTILAIWMAQTFFDPHFGMVSIAPASYVLWQNLVNSWQIWRFNRKKQIEGEKEKP